MFSNTKIVLTAASALALSACAQQEEEPMMTPIFAKDGTVIGQTVVEPGMDDTGGVAVISDSDNMDVTTGPDGMDDMDDDSDDDDDSDN